MYKISPDMSDIEVKKYSLLNRIERLEHENDYFVASNGHMNIGIYNEIQKLYDEIEDLNRAENNHEEADKLREKHQRNIKDTNLMLNLM